MLMLPPCDPLLPQLQAALDGEHMRQVFGKALTGPVVESCEIDRVKYRPRRTCSVSYRLKISDGGRGRYEQRISARFCSGGDAQRRYAKALANHALASPAGPSLQHAPELDMLAWWLPNDPQLPGLRLLFDAGALRTEAAPDWLQAQGLDAAETIDLQVRLVQLVPERRACARVDATQRSAAGTALPHSAYVKCHADGRGGLTHARMQALSRSTAQAEGRLCTPISQLWQPALGLHWQQAMPGQALQQAAPEIGVDCSAAVGATLAALHGCNVPWGADAPLDAGRLLAGAEEAAGTLAAVDDGWAEPAGALLVELRARAGDLHRSPMRTLHGDLHPNNVLVQPGAATSVPTLIDLDSLRCGPAALELGGWIADAAYRAALAGQSPEQAWPACEAFLAAYALHGGSMPPAEALAWGAVHQLLCRRAYGAVANLKPGRLATVPALLEAAGRVASSRSVMSLFHAPKAPAGPGSLR